MRRGIRRGIIRIRFLCNGWSAVLSLSVDWCLGVVQTAVAPANNVDLVVVIVDILVAISVGKRASLVSEVLPPSLKVLFFQGGRHCHFSRSFETLFAFLEFSAAAARNGGLSLLLFLHSEVPFDCRILRSSVSEQVVAVVIIVVVVVKHDCVVVVL